MQQYRGALADMERAFLDRFPDVRYLELLIPDRNGVWRRIGLRGENAPPYVPLEGPLLASDERCDR